MPEQAVGVESMVENDAGVGDDDESFDLLVLGSGVAGLSAAVRAAGTHGMRVGIVTKGELHQSTTRWAQGGVAAVLSGDPDSTDSHLADTLRAGAGLCEPEAVRILVHEGPGRVNELIALGAMFDRDADGRYDLAREGGHSHARVLHAGGAATGVEVERALVEAVHETAAAVHEGWFATDLVVDDGRCQGITAVTDTGETRTLRSEHVLIATGGAGELFAVSTNPAAATGDGIAMGLRAGAAVADLEFVQFHPTALHHGTSPRPLLSEALRGHGALIRDHDGSRFVDELLARDEVSRQVTRRMLDTGVDHVYLDVSPIEDLPDRFPTIHRRMIDLGLDPIHEWLPIAPAAHYLCGGLVTDLHGATTLPGLWAAGETTCTGVHGANRLASNSLLDGMVFGARVVEAVEAGRRGPAPTGAMAALLGQGESTIGAEWLGPLGDGSSSPGGEHSDVLDVPEARKNLQQAMTRGAGVLRDARSLAAAADQVRTVAARRLGDTRDDLELRNLADLASALLVAASTRTESRGAHTRSDHPSRNDDRFTCRLVIGEHPSRNDSRFNRQLIIGERPSGGSAGSVTP